MVECDTKTHSAWRRRTIRYANNFRNEVCGAVNEILKDSASNSENEAELSGHFADTSWISGVRSSNGAVAHWAEDAATSPCWQEVSEDPPSPEVRRKAQLQEFLKGGAVTSHSLHEPLVNLDRYRQAAISLHEAISLRGFDKPPASVIAWDAYVQAQRMNNYAAPSVWILLLLTVFETPLWCNTKPLEDPGGCQRATDRSEYLLSGLPLMPVTAAVALECAILGLLLTQLLTSIRVYRRMRDTGFDMTLGSLLIQGLLLFLSFIDITNFVMLGSEYRAAPFLRFGLAALSVPKLRELLQSFFRTTLAISKVGMFWAYTVIMFAWISAMILDDQKEIDKYGAPVNQGFSSFSDALYSCFAALTTSTLPDVLVPSYTHNRLYILMWIPFILLGAVLLNEVILAGVYTDYSHHQKDVLSRGREKRVNGIGIAFSLLKSPTPMTYPDGREENVVRFSDFEQLVDAIKPLLHMSADKEFLRVLFQALDDDENGVLCSGEFQDMCDVLQFHFTIVRRDSHVRCFLEDMCPSISRLQVGFLENRDTGPNLGYCSRYPNSWCDRVMNLVLAANVAQVLLESVYDLNDMQEPPWATKLDLFFSHIYLAEVCLKLTNWTFEEYWYHVDNRFDLVTSVILYATGVAYVWFDISVESVRHANALRLLRLLKALKHVRLYQRTCMVVTQMLSSCWDVLLLNLLVVLLWASAGVQLVGGQLVESNPRLHGKDLDFFSSHYQVFNFNDVPMGMLTLFMWTLGSWNDPIAVAIVELADPFTLYKALIWIFLVSYYVASPLLAYNVFSAFSIDVYQKLDEDARKQEDEGGQLCEVEQNLLKIQAEMADQGLVLHIQESADLKKLRVHTSVLIS
eukprot:TRINITY_DN28542_c0_g1_i1.p1 TRINITY_DN28542_c0_g1~~TRINITY_DN28542_c0_g1_i1.p1  ORF type:complete len:864 (-),score=160.57 TRINITY_DN28542_c0_g1_i1:70-2637(-)